MPVEKSALLQVSKPQSFSHKHSATDFTIDIQHNGDILIWEGEDYVGVQKHGQRCDIQKMINDYMRDND